MDFIFNEVVSKLMEWSYHEEDEYRIKIAAYAHFSLNKQYDRGFVDDESIKSRETSKLFADFGYPELKNKYEQENKINNDDVFILTRPNGLSYNSGHMVRA